MRSAFFVLAWLLVAATVAAEAPPGAGEPPDEPFATTCERPLRFGFSPYLTAGVLRSAFEPVVAHLSLRLGVPIEIVIPETYADVLTLLAQNALDLAYLTPVLYVKARRSDPRVRLLVTDVWQGVDFYAGYLVVLSDSGITSLEQLRGRRLAYVDRESASGYLLPRRELRRLGFPPEQTFSEIVFSGDHLRALGLLLAREVDVAAVSSSTLAALRRQKVDLRGARILMKTGAIPTDAICATSSLPDDVAARLTEILLSLGSRTPEGRALLPKTPRANGWRPGNPRDYDEIELLLAEEEALP
jgi:phosphate/phosphite/phosphonate ABC transporter binding protein